MYDSLQCSDGGMNKLTWPHGGGLMVKLLEHILQQEKVITRWRSQVQNLTSRDMTVLLFAYYYINEDICILSYWLIKYNET